MLGGMSTSTENPDDFDLDPTGDLRSFMERVIALKELPVPPELLEELDAFIAKFSEGPGDPA